MPTEESGRPEVFISYSRTDGDFAEVLRRRLEDAGFDTWVDLDDLRAGDAWGEAIDGAIRGSVALVVILTPASRGSDYVSYEWAFALGAEVPVIPLLLQPTPLPPRMAAIQHLDFTRREDRPWESLMAALETAVEARPTQSIRVPRHAPALVRQAVADLDSPDSEVMRQAMVRLSEMGTPEADDALVQALRHPLPDVRIEAAWRLSDRGDVRAFPGLLEGNRRRGWHFLFADRVALLGAAAVPPLRSALEDKRPWMRRDVVWAMSRVGDPGVVPDLIRCLSDPDAEVRREAARVLKGFDVPEARAAVAEAMRGFVRDLQEGEERLQRQTAQFLDSHGDDAAREAVAAWRAARSGEGPLEGPGLGSG